MKKVFELLLIFLFPFFCSAATSENYKIDADVIGIGGVLGSSESYKLTDTLGEPIIGVGTSETYKTKAGFWHMTGTSLSLVVDSNTKNLGNINPGTPVTAESTLGVTSDSWGGYDLLASEDQKMTHTDLTTIVDDYSCPISLPCLWTGTGLGFTVKLGTGVEAKWGTNPDFKYAGFPAVSTIFHEKTGYSNGADNTVVQYKVDTPGTQKSGDYSNIITYTAIAKL
jgi:hypothetical protein